VPRGARIKARLPTEPVPASGVLQIATWPVEIPAIWSTIPRFALVDLEIGAATDPGPCVELRRAQRIEQVSAQLVKDAQAGVASTVCTQPCDNDPREPEKAQNSAAYLELTGTPAAPIPVAVIADDEPYLQGLRFDVRPEGPSWMASSVPGRSDGRASRSTTCRARRARSSPVSWTSRAASAGRRHAARGFPTPASSTSVSGSGTTVSPPAANRRVVDARRLFQIVGRRRRRALARAPLRPVTMAAMRLYAAAALGLLALTTTASARAATARIRVAIPEFQLDGSPPPALGIQLQDGFVLGWVRGGAQVLDPSDTAKKLEGHPSCSAATPRRASRRSGRCSTSATSCA
jgi:hypothetical protein